MVSNPDVSGRSQAGESKLLRSEGRTGDGTGGDANSYRYSANPTSKSGYSYQWHKQRSWGETSRENSERRKNQMCTSYVGYPRCADKWLVPLPPLPPPSCVNCFQRERFINRFFRPTLTSSESNRFPVAPLTERSDLSQSRGRVSTSASANGASALANIVTGFPTVNKFGFLSDEARSAMLANCESGVVDCRFQSAEIAEKRMMILQREMSVYGEAPATSTSYDSGGYGYGYRAGFFQQKPMSETRLDMALQLKQALLKVAGLEGHVTPINDGTFQQDVLLTEQQSAALMDALRETAKQESGGGGETSTGSENDSSNGFRQRRYKRLSLFLEEVPVQRWDVSSPIPFYFDESVADFERHMVLQAHQAISSYTCIQFEERSTKPTEIIYLYYIKIASPTFCGLSYVGKVAPLNPIYMSFMCQDPVGIAIHETMHSLGVLHQHLRSDRAKYIDVNWANINPQLYDYFAIANPSKFTQYGVHYDYGSVMHYAPFTGAINITKPTMMPKYEPEINLPRMGQRKRLSAMDAELLNAMYCRPADCEDRSVYCGVWALMNLCDTFDQSGWMKINCRKSCKLC